MKVRVTQDHIDRGCRQKGDACPVFLAMRDAGIPVTWVTASGWTVSDRGSKAYVVDIRDLPYDAITFIALFDQGPMRRGGLPTIKPFEFEVEYP